MQAKQIIDAAIFAIILIAAAILYGTGERTESDKDRLVEFGKWAVVAYLGGASAVRAAQIVAGARQMTEDDKREIAQQAAARVPAAQGQLATMREGFDRQRRANAAAPIPVQPIHSPFTAVSTAQKSCPKCGEPHPPEYECAAKNPERPQFDWNALLQQPPHPTQQPE